MRRPRSDRQLRRWYRNYNIRYFGGKLPATISLIYETTDRCFGDCWLTPQGWFRIRVDPDRNFGRQSRRFTLLHEMAHVNLWGFNHHHGPIFNAEMLRLANAGAMKGLW
jgi:hypothetical protein